MTIREFIFSRTFLKHFALAVLITLLLIFAIIWLLKLYTNHGAEVEVPDFTGLTPGQVASYNGEGQFEFLVIDSVYDQEGEKGTVFLQDPRPGSMVKEHRKIYLTLVATQPEKISMPDLRDLTLRQALAILQTYELGSGEVEFVPNIARNAVLDQKLDGNIIEPGTMIEKGTVITLVVGLGTGSGRVAVPFLLGKSLEEAQSRLLASSLSLGAVIIEDGSDTADAVVTSQKPGFPDRSYLDMGAPVNLWLNSRASFDLIQHMLDAGFDQETIDSLMSDTSKTQTLKNEDEF
jgi:eukaryotic-like serine/threonine-protein kinase